MRINASSILLLPLGREHKENELSQLSIHNRAAQLLILKTKELRDSCRIANIMHKYKCFLHGIYFNFIVLSCHIIRIKVPNTQDYTDA